MVSNGRRIGDEKQGRGMRDPFNLDVLIGDVVEDAEKRGRE